MRIKTHIKVCKKTPIFLKIQTLVRTNNTVMATVTVEFSIPFSDRQRTALVKTMGSISGPELYLCYVTWRRGATYLMQYGVRPPFTCRHVKAVFWAGKWFMVLTSKGVDENEQLPVSIIQTPKTGKAMPTRQKRKLLEFLRIAIDRCTVIRTVFVIYETSHTNTVIVNCSMVLNMLYHGGCWYMDPAIRVNVK